ncbi:hypothetical protein CROQUDRAFT_664338 [Cronartium quercuum f. sp. fusiforme G11]|uniref:Aminopeptidase P N-terminal domain-containing protein n=1 Tax=Cronartium quercuum f. sp. fusiforme G11 TaxID=708437 RepID=A0A9P6NC76_9BASI|nr:hypothetical protein CROQUDRAFT_664338 [Cronartium quercuum f. sp. fusiforme G11]
MLEGMNYPCRKHAAKVFEQILKECPDLRPIIYLEGHKTTCRDDTDRELPFHQESNFTYLTGATTLRSASVIISLNKKEIHKNETIKEEDITTVLFLKEIDSNEVMWSGLPPTKEMIKKELPSISLIKSSNEIHDYLNSIKLLKENVILNLNDQILLKALNESRSIKTEEEIQILKKANLISSNAHQEIMKKSKQINSELIAQSIFLNHCNLNGIKHQAYEPIFGHGKNASILHYTENDEKFENDFNGLLLIDAGCELFGYASDITRVIPIGNNGKFTQRCKEIYKIVLDMQEAALNQIKSGVDWREIQFLMHKVAAKGLLKLGILKNLTIEEAFEGGHTIPFYPHGVGHFLGLDTHDVGGLPDGKGSHPALTYLRLQRILKPGNVVTVEPGLYFNEFLLESTRQSKFIDQVILEQYMEVGGVRIEDNVVVRENGYENLTTAVKSVEDVERLCSGQS